MSKQPNIPIPPPPPATTNIRGGSIIPTKPTPPPQPQIKK